MVASQNSAECSSAPGTVNCFFSGTAALPARLPEPPGPMLELRRRMMGYLFGCFGRGARYMLWSHEKFSRATRCHRARSAKHIARAWGVFRRLSPNFDFALVRVGRSFHWRVMLKHRSPLPAMSNAEVRRRLAAYIAAAQRAKGARRVVVGEAFLEAFAKASGVPISRVRQCAKPLITASGFPLPSPPHFPHGDSSASQRKDLRQPGRRPAPAPFFISGRWVSQHRLLRLACVLALGPLREVHAGYARVRWRMAHARGYAFRALVAGHQAGPIIRAYAAGVRRSHADAVDCGESGTDPAREPSAAVAYAAAGLADGQTPAARWAAFFATARETRKPLCITRPARENAGMKSATAAALLGAKHACEVGQPLYSADCKNIPGKNAALLALPNFLPRNLNFSLPPADAGQRLLGYLRGRGISWDTFSALPWAHKESLVARAIGP